MIARKNKILPIRFIGQDMTTYSGLTLIDHYFRIYKIHRRLKDTLHAYTFKGDYSIGDILFILIVMLLIGTERLQHIDYLRSDPLFCRVIRLTRIPHRTKLSTALKQFTSDSLKALAELNSQLVVDKLQELGLNEITVDLDGTVISSKGHPSWAFKGYNPIKKGAKSYFPLTAHVGETGHFLSILNRPGNVHDSNRALVVIQTIRRQLFGFGIRFRADSAFCDPKVISYLLTKHIGFAIKAPFWKLLNLKTAAQHRKKWYRINNQWSYFWLKQPLDSVAAEHYAMILRKNCAVQRNITSWICSHPTTAFMNTQQLSLTQRPGKLKICCCLSAAAVLRKIQSVSSKPALPLIISRQIPIKPIPLICR